MTIVIIVLPVVVMILAIVFVVSRRGGKMSENKRRIDMKMVELEQELEKVKKKGTK